MLTALSVHSGGLGRFGNQLFTIAGTIGIAIKNGQPFAFPEWVNKDNALFGGSPDRMEEYFVTPLPRIPDSLTFTELPYHWEYKNWHLPTGNYNVNSHLQSERYFNHCIGTVREYFTMKDEVKPLDFVAIHYRAGDYIDDPNAYHPRCSPEYYRAAMQHFPGENFMVFTDSRAAWVEKMGAYWTFFEGDYIKSFKAMKACRSFICANSSFSHMAALLADQPGKKIFMPRRWFGPTAGITMEGQYPESAIII